VATGKPSSEHLLLRAGCASVVFVAHVRTAAADPFSAATPAAAAASKLAPFAVLCTVYITATACCVHVHLEVAAGTGHSGGPARRLGRCRRRKVRTRMNYPPIFQLGQWPFSIWMYHLPPTCVWRVA